ncbi:hypothetical protein COOONC_13339 [Cooperia oncophora]
MATISTYSNISSQRTDLVEPRGTSDLAWSLFPFNFVVTKFRRAEFHDVSTSAPNRISWVMKNFDLGFIGDLSGAVNIVVPFNLTGQAEVQAEGLSVQLDSAIERAANGSAHISSIACHSTIRAVDVTNHNGGLFGLAVTVFKVLIERVASHLVAHSS